MEHTKVLPRTIISMALWCFFSFTSNEKSSFSGEKAFEIITKDSIVLQINLLEDPAGLPDYYSCFVETPVCNDGLCRMMALEIYWDLLGNFERFKVPSGQPLTKWDHLEFTDDDYLKLREILADKRSLLGRVDNVNDLFDKNTKKVSEKVDAVTGATMETVKNAVVSGAVYSSYTMWHIVNGPIAFRISQLAEAYKTTDMLRKFLLSDNYHYHYFALDHLSESQMLMLREEISQMMKTCSPFVRKQALERIPASLFDVPDFQADVTGAWQNFDYNSQQLLLDRLSEIILTESGVGNIIEAFPVMNEYQLGRAIDLLEKNNNYLSKSSIQRLADYMQKSESGLEGQVYDLLLEMSKDNKTAKKSIKKYEKLQL